MRRVASYFCGAVFTVTAALMLSAIVVLAAGDRSLERSYGTGPGLALMVLLEG